MIYKIKIFKEEDIEENAVRKERYSGQINRISPEINDIEIFRADMDSDTTIEILNNLFRLESQKRAEVNREKRKDE